MHIAVLVGVPLAHGQFITVLFNLSVTFVHLLPTCILYYVYLMLLAIGPNKVVLIPDSWSYFITRWGEYKTGTKLVGHDVVAQLLECCDEELRKDLTRAAGKSLINSAEKDVLTAMKALAVRSENTMVARVALSNMRQGHEEPIRSFDLCRYQEAGRHM